MGQVRAFCGALDAPILEHAVDLLPVRRHFLAGNAEYLVLERGVVAELLYILAESARHGRRVGGVANHRGLVDVRLAVVVLLRMLLLVHGDERAGCEQLVSFGAGIEAFGIDHVSVAVQDALCLQLVDVV